MNIFKKIHYAHVKNKDIAKQEKKILQKNISQLVVEIHNANVKNKGSAKQEKKILQRNISQPPLCECKK